MAVGNPNRQNNGTAFTAKLALKEGTTFLEIPHFVFQSKQGSEYLDLTPEQIKEIFGVDGPIRDVAGDLVAVDTRPGEFEGKPIHNVTLSLRDSARNEVYFTQFVSNNNLGRSIANSLLNLAQSDENGKIVSVASQNVQLGLWGQSNKQTKKTYPACSIRQGDSKDTVKWKYDPKTAAEIQPRVFEGVGGAPTKDWTKVDAFLFAELAKLGDFLKANRGSQTQSAPKQAAPQNETPAASSEAPAQTETTEDPPF